MNLWITAASGLSALTLGAHIIGGGKEVHLPMLGSPLSPLLKGYASVLWHMVTVVLLTDTIVLILTLAGRNTEGLLLLILMQSIGFAALFVWYGLRRHNNITTMPQWIAFVGIAGLIAGGLNRNGAIL